MPLIINNQHEEVANGPFSIKLSIYNNDLAVLITDTNTTIKAQYSKGQKPLGEMSNQDNEQWQNQVSKPCIVERNLKFFVDRGTFKENIICTLPPPDCPPPPCDDKMDREQNPVAAYAEEQESNTNILQFSNQQVTVFGFTKIGNFDRSIFHTVTYQYKIPESNFAPGFNLLQIYLEEEDDVTNLIYSKGIEKTDVVENTTVQADPVNNLPEASSRKIARGKPE